MTVLGHSKDCIFQRADVIPPYSYSVSEPSTTLGPGRSDPGMAQRITIPPREKPSFCFEGMKESGSEGVDELVVRESNKGGYFDGVDCVCIISALR